MSKNTDEIDILNNTQRSAHKMLARIIEMILFSNIIDFFFYKLAQLCAVTIESLNVVWHLAYLSQWIMLVILNVAVQFLFSLKESS